MRCFIYGTGRCGTVAIAKAFEFCDNYTVAHESYTSLLCYPDNHIEVNPQLRVRMGAIISAYPDAEYVWLRRDIVAVASSYERLDRGNWLQTWWNFHPTMMPRNNYHAALIAARWLEHQCQWAFDVTPEERRRKMWIEEIWDDFRQLWDDLQCTGNIDAALASFDTPQNTSAQRGDA